MEKVRISLQNISKSYYSETAVTQALSKVSLTFGVGEFVAITGESGSGKSTLLNIIGGMDTFDDGEMFVDGEPTFQYDDSDWEEYRRTKIGYVFQDYSLVGHYTAIDNVMSALLVMGNDRKTAEEIAKKYLAQVGLNGYETHRASELSSGQKQRLSIARALAKNTGIIVADEPTGNLDTETGNQIIRLLKELSKERLVIMVTHNYDQAEQYVTRKIRLHDGRIISDVEINHSGNEIYEKDHEEVENNIEESNQTPPSKTISEKKGLSKKEERKWQNNVARYFAGLNCKTQKGRAILFTSFLFVISVVSFLFIGELFLHADDHSTMEYSHDAFYREDPERLTVKRNDGKEITEDDVKKVSKMSNVRLVDECNYANDINYYITKNKDYKYLYGTQQNSMSDDEVLTVSFINETHFMMSDKCIDKSDLASGRMPEARNEIVLYSKDKKVLDSEIQCYFMAHNIWDQSQYYQTNLKVVGLLKEETEQVYFTKELCEMLSMHINSGVYRLCYNYDKYKDDYEIKQALIPVISDELSGNQARVSFKYEGELSGTYLMRYQDLDENGNPVGDVMEDNLEIKKGDVHKSTANFIEVSEEYYNKYYKKANTQMSVYMTSYAKTDKVMKKLKNAGYDSVSTYRLSTTKYVDELVSERLTIIGISAFGLVAILLAEVLILRSLMKIRVKDYFVLKFIGMKMQIIKKISYFEVTGYCLAAVVITVILMWILRLMGISIVEEMMWYYSGAAYLLFVLYNLLLSTLTVASFNHLLKGRLNA